MTTSETQIKSSRGEIIKFIYLYLIITNIFVTPKYVVTLTLSSADGEVEQPIGLIPTNATVSKVSNFALQWWPMRIFFYYFEVFVRK